MAAAVQPRTTPLQTMNLFACDKQPNALDRRDDEMSY
jgi:hypothetical protein